MNKHMVKRFIYSCLWNVAYVCISVVWFSSCEDDDKFETLIGNWYNSDIGYICFRNDGTGFILERNYIFEEKLHQQGNFVYKHEHPLDSLVFLQFEKKGIKDTLELQPVGINEIVIDGFVYLRVKNEPVMQSEISGDNDE